MRHAIAAFLPVPPLFAALLACIVLGGVPVPAHSTTLTRCKIDHRIVYSDTDCPRDGSSGHISSSRLPASKPITIRYPRKKPATVSASRKKTSH